MWLRLGLVGLLCLSFFSSGQPLNPTKFLIGVVDNPSSPAFRHQLKQIYRELDIRVEYVELPIGRRMIALNDGLLDAVLGGKPGLEDHYENILTVTPPLLTGTLVLYCRSELPCSRQILQQPEYQVFGSHSDSDLLRDLVETDVKASYVALDRQKSLFELYQHGRIDYFIDVRVDNGDQGTDLNGLQQVELGSVGFYHYVHAKHVNLVARLSEVIDAHTQ